MPVPAMNAGEVLRIVREEHAAIEAGIALTWCFFCWGWIESLSSNIAAFMPHAGMQPTRRGGYSRFADFVLAPFFLGLCRISGLVHALPLIFIFPMII